MAWSVLFYTYWRFVRSLHTHSKYRAYDSLFLTIILGIVLARGTEVLFNFDFYSKAVNGLQFAYFWDLHLNYLTLIFVPLLAYQFQSFNIERNLKWKRSAEQFVLFGVLTVMLVEFAELIRGLILIWPSNLILYHFLQTAVVATAAGVILLKPRIKKLRIAPQILLVAVALAIVAINLAIPVLTTPELNATLITQMGLCLICILPFVSRPPQRTNLRPNPKDFRQL